MKTYSTMDNTMDPTDFLKEATSHDSTRTMETEDATHQSSFSSTSSFPSSSLDTDLHDNGMGRTSHDSDDLGANQRNGYFSGLDSNSSFMLEESFALGESFSSLGEIGPPRRPRERPDLSTVIDIEEEEMEEDRGMEDTKQDDIGNNNHCQQGVQKTILQPQTSNISVEA